MSIHLGNWHKKGANQYTRYYGKGYKRFNISFKIDRENAKLVRALLMGDSPQFYSRLIDLVVDVWGMAGPDFCTQP